MGFSYGWSQIATVGTTEKLARHLCLTQDYMRSLWLGQLGLAHSMTTSEQKDYIQFNTLSGIFSLSSTQ